MSREIFQVVISLFIAILVFWLIYRIKRKMTDVIWNKIVDEYPLIKEKFNSLQLEIDSLNSRVDTLENRLRDFERKT